VITGSKNVIVRQRQDSLTVSEQRAKRAGVIFITGSTGTATGYSSVALKKMAYTRARHRRRGSCPKSTHNFGVDPNLFYGLWQSFKHFPRAARYVDDHFFNIRTSCEAHGVHSQPSEAFFCMKIKLK
jgi:hypothetical protein